MNKLLIEFMRENELSDDLLWKKAAERQMMFVRDEIGIHLTHSPIFVVSTHTSKSCLLPVYAFRLTNGIKFIMRENFYGWVVSIDSPFPIEKLPDFCTGDSLCAGDAKANIAKCYCEGFRSSWVHKYKNENFCLSTFRVRSDYDLYALIYILNNLEGTSITDEPNDAESLSTCIRQAGERHSSCDSIYDVFMHSYFATANYDFCKKNNLDIYYGSKFKEEDIKEFANRLSNFKEIRLMFLDELGKIQWGENFK